MTKHAQPVVPIVPNSLNGIRNEQPGSPHSFYATIEVEVEVDWKVKLVEAHPPGINPLTKLLRFQVELPHGRHSNTIAKRTLRYDEKPLKADYTEVTVEDGGQTTSAPVKVVV